MYILIILNIKTRDSESRGQEEAGRTRRVSVLFTGSTGVKFVNALNKPPRYRLVIKDSACCNDIESVTQQWRKSAPPILSASHCEFNGARSCAHAWKTIPLAPIHPFTKQMLPLLCPESLTRSMLRLFSPVLCVRLIKGFLPPKTFLRARRFFLVSLFVCFFHFHCTLFRGHMGAWTPEIFFKLSFCAFISLSNNSLISMDFSQTWVSNSPMYALPVILISAWSKHLNIF